jgi:hypothetical protein
MTENTLNSLRNWIKLSRLADPVDDVTVRFTDGRAPETVTLTAPVVVPPPVIPPVPTKPVLAAFPTILKAGDVVDLGGASLTLTHPINALAELTVCNGSIKYDGDGGKVGSDGMSCFIVGKGNRTDPERPRFDIPQKVTVVSQAGGTTDLRNITQTNGGLVHALGGDSCSITHCESDGIPDKYWFCNFTNRLKVLRINNTGAKPINQGKHEAAVRLMQVDDSEIVGLTVHGSNFKQAVQDRPGGAPSERYKQHIWRDCNITGGVDIGNFKDKTDVNFPFGRLGLSQWDNCKIDRVAHHGAGRQPVEQKGYGRGQDRDEREGSVTHLVNCTVGGKQGNT